MKHALTLYGKPDCHLCHEARALLQALQSEFSFSFTEIDITADRTVEEKYRNLIPVIVVDDALELPAPILERE
ncbi:MAG: glutaredoxin family protein, partial [Chloroflexi bacterium]|nr:glutaredoxin family protein [Chloroflexota bacterium]